MGGVCAIESYCNAQSSHPGSQYQGFGQLGTRETYTAINQLSQMAQSPKLSPTQQAQVQAVVSKAQTLLSSGQNPNADSVVGPWLLVGLHVSLGTLTKVSAVTSNPQIAAAYLENAQLAPVTFNGNFGPNTVLPPSAVWAYNKQGWIPIAQGTTAGQAAQQMLGAVGTKVNKGISFASQYNPLTGAETGLPPTSGNAIPNNGQSNGTGGGGNGGNGNGVGGGSGSGGDGLLPGGVGSAGGPGFDPAQQYQVVSIGSDGSITKIGGVIAGSALATAAGTALFVSTDDQGNPDGEVQAIVSTQSANGTKDIALVVDQDGNLVLDKNGNPIPVDPTTVPKPTWNPSTNTYTIDTTPPATPPNPWLHQQSGNPYAGNQTQTLQPAQIGQTAPQRPQSGQPPYQTPAQPIAQPLPLPQLPFTGATSTPTSGSAVVTIVANPSKVASSSTSRIVWSSVGTVSCQVGPQQGALIGTSTNGTALSAPLATSTVFVASCVTQTQTQISASTTVTVH
jgi:hypothetical protein